MSIKKAFEALQLPVTVRGIQVLLKPFLSEI